VLSWGSGRSRRAGALVAAVVACGAVLAGCGSGPSQIGAAAVVGDQSVSLSETTHRLQQTFAQPKLVDMLTPDLVASMVQQDPHNPAYQNMTPDQQRGLAQALLGRVVVTKQVRHLLLTQAAQRDKLTVTDQQVNTGLNIPGMRQQLSATELAFDPDAQRAAMRDRLTAQALAVSQLATLSVTVDEVAVRSEQEARTVATALAAGGQQAQQALRSAGGNARGGVRLNALQAAQSGSLSLLGSSPGEVVATDTGQGSWAVWRVLRRDQSGQPNAAPAMAAQVGADGLETIGIQLLQPLAEQLGVRVNPRFGDWDMPNLIVLGPGQPRSIVIPAAPAQG
jgi:hypothetical protein